MLSDWLRIPKKVGVAGVEREEEGAVWTCLGQITQSLGGHIRYFVPYHESSGSSSRGFKLESEMCRSLFEKLTLAVV